MMNRARIGKLSSLLSLLSAVAIAAGWTLIVQTLGHASPGLCRLRALIALLVAPGLAAASLVTQVMQNGPGEKRPGKRFSAVVAVMVLIGAGLTVLPPVMLPFRNCSPPSNESVVTVTCLPELHNSIRMYVFLHGSVPVTLKDMNVFEPGLGYRVLDDPELLNGQKAGYVFTYTPGPPETDGTRKRYTIVARPMQFGKTGAQNFFIDETGIRRFTAEDRAATASDCPVETWDTCKR
jgi:hypothetical protein